MLRVSSKLLTSRTLHLIIIFNQLKEFELKQYDYDYKCDRRRKGLGQIGVLSLIKKTITVTHTSLKKCSQQMFAAVR